MFTLSDKQRVLLAAARAWQDEGERRFDFWAQRETLRAASECFGRVLTDSGLGSGRPLPDEARAQLIGFAARLAPNTNLSRRLWAPNPADFDRRLHTLLMGQESLPERLRVFLAVRGTGMLTASQLLCAHDPAHFPLITRPALRHLKFTASQLRDALANAADRYGFAPPPEPDAAQRLLALFTAYEHVRAALGTASYADVDGVLRLPRPLLTVTETSAVVREPGAEYQATSAPVHTEATLLDGLERWIAAQGFTFPAEILRAYYVSLRTRPFAILSGVSGTGKTRLAELFAEYVTGHAAAQFRLLPVRPDWADASPLLGYHNTLSGRYVSAPFGDMIRAAARSEHRTQAYFLCLDEMNLARVEHYLSDYLSALETRDPRIPLHEGVPDLILTPNFFVTGTVNVDDTTHGFSRKVLDRANTLDFDAPPALSVWGAADKGTDDTDALTPAERQALFLGGRLSTVGAARARLHQIGPEYAERAVAVLSAANGILYRHRMHVAYRVRDDLVRFLAHAWDGQTGQGLLSPGSEENFTVAVDVQMCQKLLPRLSGLWETLEPVLRALQSWAADFALPRTAARLERMAARGMEAGFVRFHE